MKKSKLIWLILLLIIMLVACISTPSEPAVKTMPPDFVVNPPLQEESIFGLGSGKSTSIPVAIGISEQRAKQSLAIQLNANVYTMLTNYARISGNLYGSNTNEFSKHIEQQVTAALLKEPLVMRWVKTSDDVIWAFATFRKIDAARMVAAIIEREADGYDDFRSIDAFTLMEQQLDQIITKPTLVDY
ncbi:MAG: hypothetical protein LBD29_11355 [Treponema sp.]|jgi:hypothetical protein|nr:hypothetical protein [Treponema sp.]